MRIALAQINPTLGDFVENSKKITEFIKRAHAKRADLVVFSELTLAGYPPADLLERPEFLASQNKALKKILSTLPADITVIFGAVRATPQRKKGAKPYQNVVIVAKKNSKPLVFAKQLLPSYDVFDETRFFEPGNETGVFLLNKKNRVAVSVCEDMWSGITDLGDKIYSHDPLGKLKNIDLIVNISASPFSLEKMKGRLKAARAHVKKLNAPMVYVNQVGGEDELIFDGRSFILDEKGKMIVQGACAEEDLVMIDLAQHLSEYRPPEDRESEILRKVLVLGLRDFVVKNGMKDVHMGISGGIDSALMAALAVDALGPNHVTGLLLPGPYSSQGSVDDSQKLAENLKIKTIKIDINSLYDQARSHLENFGLDGLQAGVSGALTPSTALNVSLTEQNLQARLRGVMLMAYANTKGSLLLSTSNKCELAAGYSTLYGDTNGALMPLGDLLKGQIYELAEHYNSARELIPEEILMKAPSAELAPNQVDQDSLPPYDELDKAVVKVVEKKLLPTTKTEKWLLQQMARSEFKRWQAPPILRVSEHAFGRGRRLPITQKLR